MHQNIIKIFNLEPKTEKSSIFCKQKFFNIFYCHTNDVLNQKITIRLYKRQGCLQTNVVSGNHKTKSAVLIRLLAFSAYYTWYTYHTFILNNQ